MHSLAPQIIQLMHGVTTNANGAASRLTFTPGIYQATIDGTGAVAVTVTIQGSLDGVGWVNVGSAISLTDTTTDTDKLLNTEPWPFVRAVTSSISGTGATVRVFVAGA